MKKLSIAIIFFAMATTIVSCTSSKRNPLSTPFDTELGTVPFSKIKNEHFYPAFLMSIKSSKAEIDAISSNTEAPTFQNTIEALEFQGADLSRIAGVFYNLLSSNTNDTLQDISFKVSPLLTELSSYVYMNDKLFERVKEVHSNMDKLTDIEKRLTDNAYKAFKSSGAELNAEQKEEFKQYATRLSELSLQFDKNNLAATNGYFIELTQEQAKELPQFVQDMAKEDAKAKEIDGYVITLHAPSYSAFMKYSTDRELKEKLWRASSTLSYGGEFDNSEIVNEIVNTRIKRAKLMGYETHADYTIEDNMAKSADAVNNFLAELSQKSEKYAKADMANIQKFAKEKGAKHEIMPWDFSYYSSKLKEEKFNVSDELLKPYFELNNVKGGIFELCNKLFGMSFTPNTTAEPYQEDVMIYNVNDKSGKLLGVLYMDFFPRPSKNGGAWMNTIRDQKIQDGVEQRPLVTVVCNFTKPTATAPSLLTFNEVVTFLHEFGHAIHGLNATGKYSSLSGTSVARDFVELPSQIMENWATEKEFLQLFAKHYQTGEIIPDELIEKVIDAKNFNAGYTNARQISFGLLDMAWHSLAENGEFNLSEFEEAAMKPVQLSPYQKGTTMSPSFGHIFAGGYSAGYYSYKWAEVLEADAFLAFKEGGIFNPEIGNKFLAEILTQGDNKDAMELFVNFRGHEPKIDALFKKYGMN